MHDTDSLNDNPSYYAVIPASVRYDKGLKASEKLLYGEISALANKTGECWASNRYFAGLYGVSTEAVRGWLRNLEKHGYIKSRLEYEGKEVKARYISILPNETCEPPKEKLERPPQEKLGDNNTRNNNQNNNRYIAEIKEVFDYLNLKTGKRYRPTSAQNKHVLARLNEGYSVEDCKKVIDIKVKEWIGTDMEKYLRPETLFNATKFDAYLNQDVKKPRKEIGKVWI